MVLIFSFLICLSSISCLHCVSRTSCKLLHRSNEEGYLLLAPSLNTKESWRSQLFVTTATRLFFLCGPYHFGILWTSRLLTVFITNEYWIFSVYDNCDHNLYQWLCKYNLPCIPIYTNLLFDLIIMYVYFYALFEGTG